MPKRDPFSFPLVRVAFEDWNGAWGKDAAQPHIGVTQGGSSRKNSGARPAASDGEK